VQRKIINGANARDAHTRVATAASIHECSTYAAKAVFHVVSACNCLVLLESGEFVFAAQVLEMRVFYNEVGGEHAGIQGLALR